MTTTDYNQFHLFTFFSDAGGALGLWLGYSVLSLAMYILKSLNADILYCRGLTSKSEDQ